MDSQRILKAQHFCNELTECKKSPLFHECIKNMGLQNYDIKIAKKIHKKDLLAAAALSYSKGPICKIFRLNVEDVMQNFRDRVDRLIKAGTYIILIHKTYNQIIAGIGFLDLCDADKISQIKQYQQKKQSKHLTEIHNQTKQLYFSNNTRYPRLAEIMRLRKLASGDNISNNDLDKLRSYHGTWCEGTLYFVHPAFRNKGYGSFLAKIRNSILTKLRYNVIFTANNPKSRPREKDLESVCYLKLVNIVFGDGTAMIEYFDDLKMKWNYDEKKINQLKKLENHLYIVDIQQSQYNAAWNGVLKPVNSKISKL